MDSKAPTLNAQQPAFAPAPGTAPAPGAAPAAPPSYNDATQPGQPPMQPGYYPQSQMPPAGYSGQMPQMAPGYTPAPMQVGQVYYPPPPVATGKAGMMPPPGPQQPHMVMQPQVVQTVIVNSRLGPHPINTTCPKCHANVITATNKVDGSMAWLWCFIIFILGGGIFCLCLIPFCLDGFKDTRHTCPVQNCRHVIGTHNSMS